MDRLRGQVHDEQVGVAALLQAHDHPLAVRREPRREAHAGEVADDLALAGLDVEQEHPRIALAVRHVGDFLGRRIEPRGEHQVLAAREIAGAGAVLIHDGEPFDAPLLRAGLVDEHHAGVEIALLAGQALVNRVRDDVGDAPRLVGRAEILLTDQLLTGEHIPEAELGLEPPVALPGEAAGDERLGVDDAPIGKARRRIEIGELFDVGRGIDRREQARAPQVGRDDLADAARDLAIGRRAADEIRNGNRQRRHVALGDLDLDGCATQARRGRERAGGSRAEHEAAPRQADRLRECGAGIHQVISGHGCCSSAEHVGQAETNVDILPRLVFGGRQAVGLAGLHGSQSAIGYGQEERCALRVGDLRWGSQGAVGIEA